MSRPEHRRDPRPVVEAFETARPRLTGLAYRMLGSLADAEDVVQEAWLRWDAAAPGSVRDPAAWLTTVTARLALDRLRGAQHRREIYVGPWLPEPIVEEPGPEEAAELSETLTLGFLALLDRLNPLERTVFLLADLMGRPYDEVAAVVDRTPVACRQIASRARRRLRGAAPARPARAAERQVVDELLTAVVGGDVDGVVARLSGDVVLVSDGGPTRRAARRPVVGPGRVTRLLVNLAKRMPGRVEVRPAVVNGDPGILVFFGATLEFVMAFEVDADRVAAIWLIRNPDKLTHVGQPIALV